MLRQCPPREVENRGVCGVARECMAGARRGTDQRMGGSQDRTERPTPEPERETVHGMGVSSEHDQGEVQEVDSREQE